MLQQQDVDALLAALVASQETGDAPERTGNRSFNEIKIYDFVRPDNLPSEFLRALKNINYSLSRVLSGLFTSYLSVGVQVEVLSIDLHPYRQFCQAVPEITTLAIFTISPLEGMALFELNQHLAWYLIDKGLGGQGEVIELPREFTSLERGLLEDLFRRVLREFGKVWETLVPLRPVLHEILQNPTIVRFVQPDDRMVVSSFSINMAGVSGMCTYCLPISSLDFERLLNSECDWETKADNGNTAQEHAQLLETLYDLMVSVRACLPNVAIPVGELSLLCEGDIIHLDTRIESPVEVRVEDVKCFLAHPVILKDQVAMEILAEGG